MAEPTVTASAAAVAGASLLALLGIHFGDTAAQIIMVTVAAAAGVMWTDLRSAEQTNRWKALRSVLTMVIVALVGSWGIAEIIGNYWPSTKGPHTPSLIALAIGAGMDTLKKLAITATDVLQALMTAKKGGAE